MNVSKLANAESIGERRIGVTVDGDSTETIPNFKHFANLFIKLEVGYRTPKVWFYKQ